MVQPKTVLSLANLIAFTKHEVCTVVATEGYTTAEGRSYCVIQALKEGCTHLLFIDDDMVFPKETLDILLETGKEIVGVNSHSRVLPISTTVGMMNEKGEYMHPDLHSAYEMKMPDELFEAFFVGAGVLLIDMKVFEKLERPYFAFEANEDGKVIKGEDGFFCEKARKAGIGVWCEPRIEIGHIGNYTF